MRRSNLFRFLGYVRPYRWQLVLATVTGVLKYNLPVLFPWILKEVVDSLLAGKVARTGLGFDHLMGLAVLLFVTNAVITYFRTLLVDNLGHAMVADIRADLFGHLSRLPVDFFHKYRTGAISSRVISDVSLAQSFIGLAGTNFFMDLTSLCSITVAIFLMNWKLAMITLSTLPLYVVLQRCMGRSMRNKSGEVRHLMALLEAGLYETVSGMSEVKSFTAEQEETRRFSERCRDVLHAARQNVRTYALSLSSTALLTRIPPVLVIWAGGHLVLSGELTVGALLAFYAYLEMIYNPLTRLSELNIQLATSRAAMDRLFEFFDLATEASDASGPDLIVRHAAIQYEELTFGYQQGAPLFRQLSLHVASGQRVALVGASGAGKSSLIRLLVRFHDPWSGRITIDGQDIRQVNLSSLRSRIALVQQDAVLFSGSIEDNIRVGKPNADPSELRRAAELANALEFIDEFPAGFETEIGERGIRLSGGQRQRIAIARAFLKNAPILVLDESTSNLDGPSEKRVYDALERLQKGRTTIIIAHRLSTIQRADKIVVLDRGEIVQEGSHSELFSDVTRDYRRLYGQAADTPDAVLRF
jgi:subfamily B ATP-binding cassette protein MsbA